MPVEPTKAKLKRRSSRKDLENYRFDMTHARELEQKRSRGEVSCAECRRLKIKCDKQIPCQSCLRRGCAALCPNGSLATGQGTRFVLAATEHLHRRIAKLNGRIRQLEDALADLQARHSSEPHHLLREDFITDDQDDEYLAIDDDSASGVGPAVGHPSHSVQPTTASAVVDAFGTLSISDNGISRFFGPTGGSETLLLAHVDLPHASPESSETLETPSCTPTILEGLTIFSRSFPFTPVGATADVQELIETHLPVWDRATDLCETYFTQVSWLFHTVTRSQFMDEMLPAIYKKKSLVRPPPSPSHPEISSMATEIPEDYSSPHALALFFIILSIGALVQCESSQVLGEHYYQLARAALSLQPVLEKPSVITIQTLHLLSVYNAMGGTDSRSDTSMEVTWSLTTLAAHLSQTIGLHRDSARWGLSPKAVKQRRIVFWDLFLADVWQSLHTGRPPSFSPAYIDCSYPQPEDCESPFHIWQYQFAAEVVAEVTSRTLTAEAPTYATIMELDKKVRDFPGVDFSTEQDSVGTSFERFVMKHVRETVLMYIHRSFFAQAIIDHPENPLKSQYAPSFLASYRASSTILKAVKDQFNMMPISCSKLWMMWTFAFSAAVVFGTVVTRGPRSPLAQSAMTELEQACLLFSKASAYNIRATKALPILTKLSEKARYALAAVQKDPDSASGDQGSLWNIKQEDPDDELSILAGHTRFVYSKTPQEPTMTQSGFALYKPLLSSPQSGPEEPKLRPNSQSQPESSQLMRCDVPPSLPVLSAPVPAPPSHNWTPSDRPDLDRFFPIGAREDNPRYPLVSSELIPDRDTRDSAPWANQPRMKPPYRNDPYPAPVSQKHSSSATQPLQGYPTAIAHKRHQPYPPVNSNLYPPSASQTPLPPSRPQAIHHHRFSHGHPGPTHPIYPDSNPLRYESHSYLQPLNELRLRMDHDPVPQEQHQHAMTGLADLGLAARDSRLDERWGSFMEDSGLLDGIDFRV